MPEYRCNRCNAELVVDEARRAIRCTRCGIGYAEVDGVMTEGAACRICLDGVEDLKRADDDGVIECRPCREEHPRAGRVRFDEDKVLGRVSNWTAHHNGWKHRKGGC